MHGKPPFHRLLPLVPHISPFIYFAFGALILSLAYMPKFYGSLFGHGISYWLGKISFSFYLTHLALLTTIAWVISRPMGGTAGLSQTHSSSRPARFCALPSALYVMN
jgi:peptidoglycan/LPS O-acetylase OafA/YrhL